MTPYQKHRKRWNKCTKCELCEQRSKVVLTRGKIHPTKGSDVVFIGEAPGASEDVIGQPFVGPAGKLLDHVIMKALLLDEYKNRPREVRYCLTNLVACFPKEAKESGNNEPSKECIEACAPRLKEFVRLCKPKLIVYVGKLSAKYGPAIVGIPSAFARFSLLLGGTVEIVHPAAILRMDKAQQSLAVHRCILTIADGVDDILR